MVEVLLIMLGLLVAHLALTGLLSGAALGVRRLLPAGHPARAGLLAFAKNSLHKSIAFLKSLESVLVYGFAAVMILLALSGADV